ncbi:hypothetical protein LVB77_17075 [Lysobacter sp. 5GHs7-4]|uniref:hypothetical protein n=1 Tax=Lysobacter sp. 5GHs7-4 TaxID=2904253 RepID=UPI001E366193|nr:hypothetical protein [Lysobacter sp. 5GHs7-4]UHQ22362.1 hypothetical protein LVB77_17075 [Lysobacter sp. 5GHs7-4]
MAATDHRPAASGPEPGAAPDSAHEHGAGPQHATADANADALAATIDAAERAAIDARREAAGVTGRDGAPPSTIGLALSGGGVRSATFCLGLIRGLAQNGLLPRLDYLSTVSGGGYAGAALGRLIASVGLAQAQELLRRSDTLLLGWLRRYGRYLVPRGARDYGVAIATYLRAGLAVHLEIGLLAIAIGALVVLPHMIQSRTYLLAPQDWSAWRSAWWPLTALVWLSLAPGNLMAYWALRDAAPNDAAAPAQRARFRVWDMFMVLGPAALAVLLYRSLPVATVPLPGYSGKFLACVALTSVAVYGLWLWLRIARAREDRDTVNARERDRLTAQLRLINIVALLPAFAGLLDLASWNLLKLLESGALWVYGSVGLGGLLVIVVRAFGEPIQRLLSNEEGPRPGLMPLLINVLGLGAVAIVLVLWVTVVQWWVFGEHAGDSGWRVWLAQQSALQRVGWLALALAVWFVGTGLHTETVNTTSLHGFYRSRLTRAYLAVGSRRRFPGEAVLGARRASPEEVSNIVETVDDDDVAMAQYRPDLKGGPLHLVNTCLNQTRGASSRLYNADRKGVPLVASAFGLEVGRDAERAQIAPPRLDKLGRWIAISGAAASPGAGSNTTTGWAMLLFLVGARLGYWFDTGRGNAQLDPPMAGVGRGRTHGPGKWTLALARRCRNSKFGRLMAEALASFDGAAARAWFLSDGGHFDNTGVHPLLRRQLDFIVLADCGADPDYEFADLENLIRKARIDYGAEIEFYTEDSACHLPLMQDEHICVLAPEKLHDHYTARGVMLARIRYRPDRQGRSKLGTLLVVKPNLHFALDSDVLAYARRNPAFPQQPTSDQFFDEAQWESYHRLGEDFGRALKPGWLEQLPGWAAPIEPQDALPSLRRLRPSTAQADEAVKPFWRPETKAAAISAGLGAGLAATLVVPAWNVFDKFAEQRRQEAAASGQRLKELRQKLPVWARAGLPAPGGEKDVDVDEDTQALLNDVYRQVRRERDGISDAGRTVSKVQASCGLPPSRSLAKACPPLQSAHRNLCDAVCDPPARDPYWERSTEAVALASAPDGGLKIGTETTGIDDSAIHDSGGYDSVFVGDPLSRGTSVPTATLPDVPVVIDAPPLRVGGNKHDGAKKQGGKPQGGVVAIERAPPAQAAVQRACGRYPVAVYVQVYDEATRLRAAALPWAQLKPAAAMPGIENVVRSARARNAEPPKSYRQPTLVVHRMDDQGACAAALKDWLAPQLTAWYGDSAGVELRKLPGAFKPEERVIELWLPNATVASAAMAGTVPEPER